MWNPLISKGGDYKSLHSSIPQTNLKRILVSHTKRREEEEEELYFLSIFFLRFSNLNLSFRFLCFSLMLKIPNSLISQATQVLVRLKGVSGFGYWVIIQHYEYDKVSMEKWLQKLTVFFQWIFFCLLLIILYDTDLIFSSTACTLNGLTSYHDRSIFCDWLRSNLSVGNGGAFDWH